MSSIFIDGDGCPVVQETLRIARQFAFEVRLVCDSSHIFSDVDCEIIMTDKGKDRVDFVILRQVLRGDIVITQDYGLAALALCKGAYVLSQDGLRYDQDNMLSLLNQRSDAAKLRKQRRAKYTHQKKRTAEANAAFEAALTKLLQEVRNA